MCRVVCHHETSMLKADVNIRSRTRHDSMTKLVYACFAGCIATYIIISLWKTNDVHKPLSVPIFHRSPDLDQSAPGRTGCTPATRVYFAKVHKAGSSTVASIVQRFGLVRDLNFVVPNRTFDAKGSNYIGHLGHFGSMDDVMTLPKGYQYDVLWNHVIYNRTAFKNIMPLNTVYFAIVRQPFEQFASAFEYYGPGKNITDEFYDMENHQELIEDFLKHPWDFEPEGVMMSHTRNSLAYDFGFTVSMITDKTLRHRYITQLDRDFKLVMLLEYFDESLVLLKRYLCWDTKDILYFHRNRFYSLRNQLTFTQKHRERHRFVAEADYDIYEYFRSLFWEKIWREGPEFFSEVADFKQLLSIVADYCLLNKTLHVATNSWHNEFTVTWEDCEYMNATEFDLYEIIYNNTVAFNNLKSSDTPD